MDCSEIKNAVNKQRAFFQTGITLSVKYRINALKRLKANIQSFQHEITDAIAADLGKSETEAFMCEVGLVITELSYMIKHIKKFAKDKSVSTPISNFPAKSFIKSSPYGNVLIMSPWNYPFMLAIDPLVDALAAGNTAIVKPSAYSPATSAAIESLIEQTFSPEYVAVVTGGRTENACLLEQKFDYIFFTGSQAVGKEVLRRAADFLTPVTLELGGKSPCIIDSSAKIKLAAKRLVWGKFLNCGQTCVAPDYVLCHSSVKAEFIKALAAEITAQFGTDIFANRDYGKMINKKHFDRVVNLIDRKKLVYGGRAKPETLQIEPAILDKVTWEDAVMGEEIFGPVLPVLTFDSYAEIYETLKNKPKPLAFYLFTENRHLMNDFTSRFNFGGGCINDCVIHLATNNMGFGGCGESGMGAYHGKTGFDTFSTKKSIVNRKTFMDVPLRKQPYTKLKRKLLNVVLR